MVAPHEAASAPERAHPRAGLLDERSRAHDTHSFPCTEVPDVVRDEPPCSCTDRCREDRHVLGVGQFARSSPVACRGTMDLNGDREEEVLEERGGLWKLGGQIPPDLVTAARG